MGAAPDSVYAQGRGAGGARFARLEGAWYGDGRIYFVSTTGGDVAAGQVWEYDPRGERLRLLFESPGVEVLDMPDNLCVSPHGGIVLCEDGPSYNFIRWLTPDGRIFPFARNNVVLAGERNGIFGDFRPTRVRRSHVQSRWPLAVRERAGARHHPRHNRPLARASGRPGVGAQRPDHVRRCGADWDEKNDDEYDQPRFGSSPRFSRFSPRWPVRRRRTSWIGSWREYWNSRCGTWRPVCRTCLTNGRRFV